MASNPLTRLKNPFGSNPPAAQSATFATGTTPTVPDQAQVPPRINQPARGATGRANFWGLPQWDETNAKLIGPGGQLVFDNMYRTDPDIRRLVLMVSSPVQAGNWSMDPYGGDDASDQDREIADTIWWALNDFMRPSLRQHLAEALPLMVRAGFAPFEQLWTTTVRKGKTLTVPGSLQVRLPRSVWRWWQDDLGQLDMIAQILPNRSMVTIPASELVYYRLGGEGDNWMGVSMLRGAYKPWVYKDRLERIDAIGQERKAVGVPFVFPPQNASQDQRDAMEQILANLHTNEVAYVVMPGPRAGKSGEAEGEGWDVEVVKFDSSSGDSIQHSLTYHKLAIAGSVLGDFMELGHHQVGARATADIQMDPFVTAINAFVEIGPLPPLNQLVDRIRQLNWPDAEGSPTLRVSVTDASSLSEISAYASLLVGAGALQVDPELEDWLRERADMPAANADVRAMKQAAQEAQLKQAALGPTSPDAVNPVMQSPPQMAKPAQPAAGGGKQLDAPSAKWWETLLSQDKLKEAFDGARQSVENAGLEAATPIAEAIAAGDLVNPHDTLSLTGALQGEYERLYRLGHETARLELAKQRKELMTPGDVAAGVGARFARARQRAEVSAGNIVHDIRRRLGQQQVVGLKGPQLSAAALDAAKASLHLEALDNAGAMVNDGRHDAATADPGVVGAYYTAVLDGATCDQCEIADDGMLLSADEASLLGPPNPLCEGGDRCRCVLVWVLSTDPTAVQSITG